MTDEDEALYGTLEEIGEELRRIGWDDDADAVDQAARRIRELSAEVEALKPWKETVRLLFDDAHFKNQHSASGCVVSRIESRHRAYFCAPEEKEMNDGK